MSLRLVLISFLLICLQHLLGSPVSLAFGVVCYLALKKQTMTTISFVWALGMMSDLSVGVHQGASGFSFLLSFILLGVLKSHFAVDSRPRTFLFALAGFSLQQLCFGLALTFSLGVSVNPVPNLNLYWFSAIVLLTTYFLPGRVKK